MVVDSGCMKCLDCVSVCPNDALYYGAGALPLLTEARARGRTMKKYPLSWTEEAVTAVGFVAAFFSFQGLYGYGPFLMSLGVAAILSALVLLTYQLVRLPNVAFKGWQLKRAGRLRAPGWALLGAMALLAVGWGHSAVVRSWEVRGEQAVREAAGWQGAVFDLAQPRPRLPRSVREAADRGVAAYERAGEIGWIPTLGAAPRQAILSYLTGDDTAAERYALLAIERDELAGRMHQLLGRGAFERGDFVTAQSRFEEAVAVDPHDSRAYASAGLVATQRGDFEAAWAAFERQLATFGESVEVRYNLGLVAAYAGDLDGAAREFRNALALDPVHLPARENLAGTLAAAGDLTGSAREYSVAVRQRPDDPETRVLYARVLLAQGRFAEAEAEVEAALSLAPGSLAATTLRDRIADARRR